MTQSVLSIVADDLTGALDAAAPLARPGAPVAVTTAPLETTLALPRLSISTETRDAIPAPQAAAEVGRLFVARTARNGPAGLWFKKIDSMLRGPWAEEVTAAAEGFARIIVAPAFPDMGRRTVGGVQSARGPNGLWSPAGPPIAEALSRAGLAPQPWPAGAPLPRAAVLVADAATRADLDRIVAALAGERSVLWVGSGGLAEALGRHPDRIEAAPPELFIIGTPHPVTRAQVDCLCAQAPEARILDPVRDQPGAAEAEAALQASLAKALAGPPPAGVFVTGGATLARLMRMAGAAGLETRGRVAPGLPVSRMRGGAWDGVEVVSKSGGFGDDGLLVRLARGVRGRAAAGG